MQTTLEEPKAKTRLSPMTTEAQQLEKIPTEVYDSADEATEKLANEIAELIRSRQAEGRSVVLGLATGSTPVRLYRKLIRLHRDEALSFHNVITFNLDEYYGLPGHHKESYWRFMQEQLFAHIDIPEEQIHVPDGTVERTEAFAYCREYERKIEEAGGIDLQILGIGRTGHIGFNEPGSTVDSRTRMVTLDGLTRRDAARDFLGEANVPRYAITMGVGSILDARRIVLLAWGESKAEVVAQSVEGEQTERITASFLQRHSDVRFLLDRAAASRLTRFEHPWRVGTVDWTPERSRKGVIWMAEKIGKPILKLLDEEYNEHSLSELITEQGPAYNLNIRVFNEIQHTITGWPGGKPHVDDSHRPERAEPVSKRVLVLCPEPQDVELSMGGTLHRLVDQGHQVVLAVMTSGNLAVPDDQAKLAAQLMLELAENTEGGSSASDSFAKTVYEQLQRKGDFDEDSLEIRRLKGLMRRGESRAGCETCGLSASAIRFLDLPFYEKGRYRQFLPAHEDSNQLMELLREVRPHQVFVTGSNADPSSVAATCFQVFRDAMSRLREQLWYDDCRVWLYAGGHNSWPAHEIEMAVPLSPDEVTNKVQAIYKHQTQRGQPPAGGSSEANPWEEALASNQATASLYDLLGLAEYEAIETFKCWSL